MKKKELMGFWFSSIGCPICNYHNDPKSKHNRQKSECSERQWSWGLCGCSGTPAGPLRKFLGSKEHLNWLEIDLDAAEIIFKTIKTQQN